MRAPNLASLFFACCLLFFSLAAQALPSYARQTNQECSTCHIGSFGPQLTPYGMKFKIGGYTETNVSDAPLIPLSGMALAGFTNTNNDQAPAPSGFNANNNVALIQASAFVAGKLYDNLGSFAQVTYDGVDRAFHLDNVDIRYAKELTLFEQDLTLGVSVNNNPTSQDPFNSSPAWRFPFAVSSGTLAPMPGGDLGATPVIDGLLAGKAFGLSAYSFLDNGLYVEFGGYMPSSPKYQVATGAAANAGQLGEGLTGFAPYWRLAYLKDMKKSMFTAGFFGMKGNLRSIVNPIGRADQFMDWGFDGNYQYLGTREHVFAVGGSYTHESINWGQTYDPAALNLAQNPSATLQEIRLSTSYHYAKTYGANLSFFDILGSSDAQYYQTNLQYNSDRPDSNGLIYQIDWTPFGKENSWGAYYANLRLGAQYTAYNKYNGASTGAGGYNTAFIFAWTAF
jgi:hypothetical protein